MPIGPADQPLNQARPLAGYNVFTADTALAEAATRLLGGGRSRPGEAVGDLASTQSDLGVLAELGGLAGSFEAREWGRLAEANHPVLRTHDRYGARLDEVEFHPAWHSLMEVAVRHGLAASAWLEDATAGTRHTARAAKMLVWGQTDGGHLCPVSMTYAAVPALAASPALAAEWTPRLASPTYDFGLRTPADKAGCLAGMGMTEKQGGSDVRANTTTATPVQGSTDEEYELYGHKWFTSAPMCDVFLVLAQAPGGLTCFVIPRVLPDGTRNSFRLQRLKDKLGNRSNASSEVEFDQTRAWRLGDEGRGVATIIEMVAMTRLDCVTGSASLMRAALAEAVNHTRYRHAFGKALVDQPLMRNVLADLALESEAATLTSLYMAAATDAAEGTDASARPFRRIGLAVSKYWVTKRCAPFAAEALECLGGNGYVEESGMPRLYREAPLNSIWEGSGNVNALDVLRALAKEPGVWEAFLDTVGRARGADGRFDAALKNLTDEITTVDEAGARRFVEKMALVLQGSLVLQNSPAAVADAFVASRLAGDWGRAFGTLPRGVDFEAIIGRALAV
jgi:putative acyl-CoA dehydrogenase